MAPHQAGRQVGHRSHRADPRTRRSWPRPVGQITAPARTLTKRSTDILAHLDHPPRTSNGPAEAVNERLEHLHGIALGFRNLTRYTIPSLTHTDASKTT